MIYKQYEIRKERHMTLRDLAELAMVSSSALQKYEDEKKPRMPAIDLAEKVSHALGVPYDRLVLADNYSSQLRWKEKRFRDRRLKD